MISKFCESYDIYWKTPLKTQNPVHGGFSFKEDNNRKRKSQNYVIKFGKHKNKENDEKTGWFCSRIVQGHIT